MKLESILENPGGAWMHMERQVNDGSPSGVTVTTSPATSPHGPNPFFDLPFYACDVTVIGEPLTDKAVPDGFPVHPDIADLADVGLDSSTDPEICMAVIPTASGRTVALAEAPDRLHFKLHYPGTLGRFSRRLNQRRAASAIDNSALLIDDRATLNTSAGFLPEPTALISPNGSATVIRIPTPHPRTTNETAMIPMFSLWSTDQGQPSDPDLLTQLLLETRSQPEEIIYHQLLEPIIDTWLHLGLNLGLWCEWNAQNLLITISNAGTIQRIIFRDLQGIHRDPAQRPEWADDLPTDSHRTFGEHPHRDRQQRSWLFDFKLGEYVLDPLIETAGLSPEQRNTVTAAICSRVDQRLTDVNPFPAGSSTWGQPPGPIQDGKWSAERSNPPRYRTATPERHA